LKIKSYSRIRKKADEAGIPFVEVPNLLAMQVDSYSEFLQKDVHPNKRENKGLHAILSSVFPIIDHKEFYRLE
jgi:DNA-directed RNA polymerase subunit beta